MAKLTYEQLQNRVKDLEKLVGGLLADQVDCESHELFELAVLSNVSQALQTTTDLDELLSIIIDEVNKALLTEGAGVLLYDETRSDLYWRQVRDNRQILAPQSEELRLPLDGSIAGWVFQHNKPARVNDTSKDPRYYPDMTRKSGFEIRKVLQVPLNAKDKPIGVLMVMNKIGGDFTEQDERLLTSMSGSIALAIDNAAVYEKLKKSKEDLEMIYRSSLALAATMDLDHLLTVVISELRTAVDVEAAGVLLHDEGRGDLYWREVQDEKGLIATKFRDLRLPLENSISGQVYLTGEPALLNNPNSDPKFFRPFQDKSGFTIRNEIIVPLHTRERSIGCLIVINKHHGQFTQDDFQLLLSMAGVVAMAVENANFFEELLTSYRELEDLNRVKTKILNHLSHELRTPLAIIRGTLATMQRKLDQKGLTEFDRPLERMNRHVQSLNDLEAQVESIMMTGYTFERRYVSEFLQKALDLMEVQTEYTPEIKEASDMIHKWLKKTFPTRQDVPELIQVREFGQRIQDFVQRKADEQHRKVNLEFSLDEGELLIPAHVLHAIMEGLIRNAVEATPDGGTVSVTGELRGFRYILTVKDTGVGIPEKDKQLIFQGFYPVQETEDYSSRRPYCFNAGGKGIDLLRIRMFSEIYEFRLSFETHRCAALSRDDAGCGDTTTCPHCATERTCAEQGGSTFVVDFPIAQCVQNRDVCELDELERMPNF